MSTTRPSRPTPPRRTFASRNDKLRFWARRLLILAVVGVLLLVAIFFFTYRATTIPNPNSAYQAQATTVFYKGGKSEVGQFAIQNRESIPLAEVPQDMQDAIVAAEDRTFWTNKGIDPKGILRAAFSNAQGNATQGASTITQQYVKLLYLSQERTLKRKLKEVFLSLKIHNQLSKSAILEGYLNTVYFGRGAYGVQAAAEAFFGKPAKELRLGQAAMLAAVVNSPNYLSPDRNAASRAALLSRYQYVLNGMVKAGTADPGQVEKIYAHLPKLTAAHADNKYGGQRGFMLSMVKDQLLKLGFTESEIEGGGLRVTTTFSKKAMRAAREAVADQRPDLKGLHTAVASVDVKTGALLGFYAGQDYLKSQLNWADAHLCCAPGSAFKPFALTAALEEGFSLKDTFNGNSPYTFPDGHQVHNEGERAGEANGHSYGRVSLLTATEQSINTAYMDLTQSMDHGPQKILDTAVKMGIPKDSAGLDATSGISLGTSSQNPINMANAYSTIANGGVEHPWYIIQKVQRASDGQTLYTAPMTSHRVVPEDISRDVSYALQQVVQQGTGRNALALGRPAAGKTGTATNANGDVSSSWFVGFTPQVSTAVMYVRGRGNEALNGFMPSYFGADYPTRTWTETMSKILEGLPAESFPPAANVDGTAPSSGHAPYTPPPPPPPKPKPTKTRTTTPTPTPTPTTTSPAPTTSSSMPCTPGLTPPDPDCTSTSSPSPSPTSSSGASNSGCTTLLCREEQVS